MTYNKKPPNKQQLTDWSSNEILICLATVCIHRSLETVLGAKSEMYFFVFLFLGKNKKIKILFFSFETNAFFLFKSQKYHIRVKVDDKDKDVLILWKKKYIL